MPIYISITEEGTLSGEQKKRLAEGITRIHCRNTGAPEKFVRVFFQTYLPGSGFLASAPNAVSLLSGYIRAGRDTKIKQKMMAEFWSLYRDTTGTPEEQLAIFLQDVPSSQVMEYGAVAPEPGAEAEWLAKHLSNG